MSLAEFHLRLLDSIVCWIVSFAVRKGCVRKSFAVWGTEGRLMHEFGL